MAKLADARDLGSRAARCAGSSPVTRTSRVTSAGQIGFTFSKPDIFILIFTIDICVLQDYNVGGVRNSALKFTLKGDCCLKNNRTVIVA